MKWKHREKINNTCIWAFRKKLKKTLFERNSAEKLNFESFKVPIFIWLQIIASLFQIVISAATMNYPKNQVSICTNRGIVPIWYSKYSVETSDSILSLVKTWFLKILSVRKMRIQTCKFDPSKRSGLFWNSLFTKNILTRKVLPISSALPCWCLCFLSLKSEK